MNPNEMTKIDELNKYPEKKRGRKPMNCGKIVDKDKLKLIISSKEEKSIYIAHLPVQIDESELDCGKEENLTKVYTEENNISNKNEITQLREKLKQFEIKLMNLENDRLLMYNKIFNRKITQFNSSSYHLDSNNKGNKILCWWCCHSFANEPIYLPEYVDNKNHEQIYYVRGNFCSLNCAAAYNLSLKDNRLLHRSYLLNLIYSSILTSDKVSKIIPAPPKEILKAFGGNMSIEEFRKESICYNKLYTLIYPPMKPLCVLLEEEANYNFDNDNFISLQGEQLKLRRKIPMGKNTIALEQSFGLTRKKK